MGVYINIFFKLKHQVEVYGLRGLIINVLVGIYGKPMFTVMLRNMLFPIQDLFYPYVYLGKCTAMDYLFGSFCFLWRLPLKRNT